MAVLWLVYPSAVNIASAMRVGGDGTVWLVVGEVVAGSSSWLPAEVHRLTPEGRHDTFPAPPCDLSVGAFGGWSLQADCTGRAFLSNPCQWDSECSAPFTVYVYPSGEPVAQVSGLQHAWDLASDGYGNLFIGGQDLSTGNLVFRWLRPAVLSNPAFYDGFDCCAAQSQRVQREGPGRPPGVRIPPQVCNLPGKLRIQQFPEPEDPISNWKGKPSSFSWIDGDSQGHAQSSLLFGQAPLLKAFWKAPGEEEETTETVKWEIVSGSEKAPNADASGLYYGKPAVFFTGGANPYSNAELRFQTVHTGSFRLRATTTNPQHLGPDGRPATVEVEFTVASPGGLGSRRNDLDEHFLRFADKYGIPPQYLKAQAYRESGLDEWAFRYEPRTVDKKLLSGKKERYWNSMNWELWRYRMPPGPDSLLDPEDIAPRAIYSLADFSDVPPPAWPYTCNDLGADLSRDPVTLFQIYEANDGWPCGTFPWMYYNPEAKDPKGKWKCGLETHVGPCGKRKGWWDADRPYNSDLETTVTYLRATDTFYCGTNPSQPCPPDETESQWLRNHADYVAQTVVASSYGLMQVLYTTAVQTQEWCKGRNRGAERHPCFLFDPAVSLDLGASFDAKQISCQLADASSNLISVETFREALVRGFGAYNTGKCDKRSDDYAENVLRTAPSFWPGERRTP